jgi:hypothetical protein
MWAKTFVIVTDARPAHRRRLCRWARTSPKNCCCRLRCRALSVRPRSDSFRRLHAESRGTPQPLERLEERAVVAADIDHELLSSPRQRPATDAGLEGEPRSVPAPPASSIPARVWIIASGTSARAVDDVVQLRESRSSGQCISRSGKVFFRLQSSSLRTQQRVARRLVPEDRSPGSRSRSEPVIWQRLSGPGFASWSIIGGISPAPGSRAAPPSCAAPGNGSRIPPARAIGRSGRG